MNKNIKLWRIVDNVDGTFGVLIDEDIPFAVTVERRWLNNKKWDGKEGSCIPPGVYVCKRITSPKFGNTFQVTAVPGRSEILFHKGNVQDDSHGCIIIGEQFEPLNGKTAVIASGKGFGEFLQRLSGINEFNLCVTQI